MRRLLREWSVAEWAVGLYPERADRHPHAVDRLLAHAAGRIALWSSPLARWRLRRFAARVLAQAPELEALDEEALRARARALSARLARHGLPAELVAEAFALVREVSGRRLGMRHFPVQLMGGYALLRGHVAEMATGEGKSLTGVLPAVTVALAGVPVHVITVNEYLARRDAGEMAPVFDFFGLSVGWIEPEQDAPARRAMYARDVTYCVNKDLVFDYLKDGLAAGSTDNVRQLALRRFLDGRADADRLLLRGLCYAVVDEADSIFVDEARTPLIISAEQQGDGGEHDYGFALAVARELPAEAYRIHAAERSARLTAAGRAAVDHAAAARGGVWRFRRAREQMVEQALAALHLYQRDTQYIVADEAVQIVDESTGRTMPDRTWEHGLHQLIEVKEGLEPSRRRETIARVTYQRFFCRYLWLAGMTGTGAEIAPEIRAVYGVGTIRIPTNRALRRRHLGERVFLHAEARWGAVVESVRARRAAGRAVLVGTRSVEASEHLAALLAAEGIACALLNARNDAEEAAIVAQAGQPGQVTVATNMAGRGTDIKLHPQLRDAGGLHVILTEFHESRRIDRQLFGRAGRQGDPGSCESLVALDDEIFRAHAPALAATLARWAGEAEELPGWMGNLLRRVAQGAAERRNARVRKRTLEGEKHKDRSLAFSGAGE
ncbi:MAG: Protein translocase subunit SecA [Pseudomonadales bacterium]|nr:Protein translocase subunit SecA [Pseudomonadales bacterium]